MSDEKSAPPIVVGLGEVLWDCFPDGRRPGGAPANVAYHANQLGLLGVVYSRVGRDEMGDALLEFLTQQGLNTDYVFRDAHYPTGQAVLSYDDHGEPRFEFLPDVAWDHLEFHAAAETLMHSAAAVCFGTLAQRHEDSREAIHQCLAAVGPRGLTVYDANLRAPFDELDWIERSLRMARIVKLSEAETITLCDLLEWPRDGDASFAGRLREAFEVELVCLTRGARGCTLFSDRERADQPGLAITTVDPVGAGDAFTAALILARLRGWDLEMTAHFANRYAGLVASHPGAMPVLSEAVQQLQQEFGLRIE